MPEQHTGLVPVLLPKILCSRLSQLLRGALFNFRLVLLNSRLNVLLVFVPIAIGSYLAKANATVVFTANVVAVIPLSSLLTYATENISRESGDTVGALINVTFGNLVEIVIL